MGRNTPSKSQLSNKGPRSIILPQYWPKAFPTRKAVNYILFPDLESRVGKWTGTGMMKPSGTKLSSFPDPKLRQSEEQDEQDAKPPVNFPPRKRSIPYGKNSL